jgi:hypothetical protein
MATGRLASGAPEIQAALDAFSDLTPDDDVVGTFAEQAQRLPGGVFALIEAFGSSSDMRAGVILAIIAAKAPDKEQRKAARRALHKMRSAGIPMPVPLPNPEIAMPVVREARQVVKALVSPTDGVGSRILWLVLERPNSHGSVTAFNLALNDIVGLKDMFSDEMSHRRFQTRIDSWKEQSEMEAVEVPVEYGLALLSEALSLNRESRFPIPREFLIRQSLLGELPQPPQDALIHQWVTRGQILLIPTLLEESARLFEEQPELHGWLFGYSEIAPHAHEYERAGRGSLLVSLNPNENRQERALGKAVDALFTPQLRRAFRRRLEETAYLFWKTDRERAARQAVAAAFAITDTGSLASHPLLCEIVLKSIELVLMTERAGYGPPPDADRSAYTPI